MATPSYSVGIQAAFRGFDTARFLKSTIVGLYGNWDVDIETGVRNDNPIVLEHVRPTNSVTKGSSLNGFLKSNNEPCNNPRLALSRIICGLDTSDEMAKTTTNNK